MIFTSRARSLFGLVSLAALLSLPPGCSCGDDGGGGFDFTVEEPGAGEPNAAPLWVPIPGQHLDHRLWVLEPVDVQGERVLPVGTDDRAFLDRSLPGGSEPGRWIWVSRDEEGNVWLRGEPALGLLDRPALLLPAEVRPGMRWSSGRGKEGNPRLRVEVVDRTVRDTIWGELPVWTLELTDYRGYDYTGTGLFDNERFVGFTRRMRFVEGHGPYGRDVPTRGSESDSYFGVLPLDGPPPEAEVPSLTLAPANGGTPLSDDLFVATHAEALDGTGERPILYLHGITWELAVVEGQQIATGVATALCVYLEADGSVTAISDTGDCAPPTAKTVEADGTYQSIPSNVDATPVRGSADDPRDFAFHAVFEGPDGADWALADRGPLTELYAGRYQPGHPDFDGPAFDFTQTVHQFWGYEPGLRRSDDRIMSVTALGDDRYGLLQPGAASLRTFELDAATGQHTISHSVLPGARRLNTAVTPDGPVHLVAGFGGRIDRVHVTATGVEVEPLGDVEVPTGHFMTGAVIVGGELLVTTQSGFQGTDPWMTDRGVDLAIPPVSGSVHLWRAELPTGARAPVSPLWGVTAEPDGYDARVCWPRGSGEPSTAGWSLGGFAPAEVVPENDHCVVLVRDLTRPQHLGYSSSWTIEGPLPGYGRVKIGMNVAEVDSRNNEHAFWQRFPGTEQPTRPDPTLSREQEICVFVHAGLPEAEHYEDLTGEGVWSVLPDDRVVFCPDGAAAPAASFDLGAMSALRRPFGDEPSLPRWHPSAGSEDGGLLVDGYLLRSDGSVTTLPIPDREQNSLGWRHIARFADGTVCGVRDAAPELSTTDRYLYCIDPGGSTHDLLAGQGERAWEARVHRLAGGVATYFDGAAILEIASSGPAASESPMAAIIGAPPEAEVDVATVSGVAPGFLAIVSVHHELYSDHRLLVPGAGGYEVIDRLELGFLGYYRDLEAAVADGYLLVRTDDSARRPANQVGSLYAGQLEWLRLAPPFDVASGNPADPAPQRCVPRSQLGSVPTDTLEGDLCVHGSCDPTLLPLALCPAVSVDVTWADPRFPGALEIVAAGGGAVTEIDPDVGVDTVNTDLSHVPDVRYPRFFELEPLRDYILRVRGPDYDTRDYPFHVSAYGQNISLGHARPSQGLRLGTVSSGSVDAALDATSGAVAVATREAWHVLRPDASAPLGVEQIRIPVRVTAGGNGEEGGGVGGSGGAVFSPDGAVLFADTPDGVVAIDPTTGQTLTGGELGVGWESGLSVTLAPAHDRGVLRSPGGSVVFAWSAGAISALFTAPRPVWKASFSADGTALFTLEEDDQGDLFAARYDLPGGARTVLGGDFLPNAVLDAGYSGEAAYLYQNETFGGASLWLLAAGRSPVVLDDTGFGFQDQRPSVAPFATSLTRPGVLWPQSTSQLAFYDESVLADSQADPLSGIQAPVGLQVSGVRRFEGLSDSALLSSDGDATSIISLDAAAVLHTWSYLASAETRNDHSVTVREDDCIGGFCDEIHLLEPDGTLLQTVDASSPLGAVPFGPALQRAVDVLGDDRLMLYELDGGGDRVIAPASEPYEPGVLSTSPRGLGAACYLYSRSEPHLKAEYVDTFPDALYCAY